METMNGNGYKIVDNIIYGPDTPDMTDPKGVGHFYYSRILRNKDKIAQIDGYTKEEDTFGSLLRRTVRTSLTMLDKGLKPGDFISMCSYDHLNTAIPYIASFFTGTIMAAVDPNFSVDEIVCLLKQVLPKLIFVTPTEISIIEKVIDRLGTDTEIVVFGETTRHTPFADFLLPHQHENSFKPKEPQNLNDVAVVFFSSGSTGMPKGICHSHRSMLCFTNEYVSDVNLVLCTFANPFWSVFIINVQASVRFGFSRVVYPKFDFKEPWELFYQHVDFSYLNIIQAVQMVKKIKPEKADLKNLKVLCVGGNIVTPKQLKELRQLLPYTYVKILYGQSETFGNVLGFNETPSAIKLFENNPHSIGTVIPGNCYKIVDPDSEKVLGPNQVGELRVKTPSQCTGYLNMNSSDCIDSDGWLKTGDLLYYNEELCFFIVDRIKETFKYCSYHISPVEIESVILNLESVENAVVIGKPHETDAHHPLAFIKLKSNAKIISTNAIIKHVENNLDDKKRLRGGVKFVENFPLTVGGKIDRLKLKIMVLNNQI